MKDTIKKPVNPRDDEEKKRVTNRLKRVEGQIRGIEKMVDENRYCVDILVQINAAQAALEKVGFSLLERHTKHCVSAAVKSGDGDEAIDELLSVVKQFSR